MKTDIRYNCDMCLRRKIFAHAKELFETSDIDGGLIGGASLKAEEFSKIVNYNK